MRFPSIQTMSTAARDTLARFPFVLLCAFVFMVSGIVAVEGSNNDDWVRVILAAQLGIPLLFAIAMGAEAYRWPRTVRITISTATLAIVAVYGVSLPTHGTDVHITRHIQFTVAAHLLVAFAPFIASGRLNGFWQYNRALFLRFCLSALYSGVLYAGLAIAVVAVDQLFGVNVDEKLYLDLWIVIATVFNTWVFLGGVPGDLPALEHVAEYPKGLRVFAQYILMPLVIIYLTILTAYLGKVIVTREWPSGWIGWLVSSVAVVGILVHLLVHPERDGSGNQWVRTYARWYYVAIVPATVMLLLAVGKRVDQYGITERRYLLMVLALWLGVMSLYYTVRGSRNIKLIPVSLCMVAVVTSFGPWGAFAVSQRSQVERLARMLEQHGVLVEGVISPMHEPVPFEDRTEISAVLHYIVDTHGPDTIARWFATDWDEVEASFEVNRDRLQTDSAVQAIMDAMNVEFVARWERRESATHTFSLAIDHNEKLFPLPRADIMVRLQDNAEVEFDVEDRAIRWDDQRQAIVLRCGEEEVVADIGAWASQAREWASGALRGAALRAGQARIQVDGSCAQLVVYVNNCGGTMDGDTARVTSINASVFIRWRDSESP